MSTTDRTEQWHLTVRGWVGGEVLWGNAEPSPPPADRLATYEASYEVCSQYGTPIGVRVVLTWSAPSLTADARAQLRARFVAPWDQGDDGPVSLSDR